MPRGWFDKPVDVMVVIGRIDSVMTPHKAAEMLRPDRWPVHGDAYRRACRAVVDAYEGTGTDEAARAAFEAAAIEAGVLTKGRPGRQ